MTDTKDATKKINKKDTKLTELETRLEKLEKFIKSQFGVIGF